MKNSRSIVWTSILTLAVFAGCQGHSKEVAEGASIAKQRLDGLKAATEFQMAEAAYSNEDLKKAMTHATRSIDLNKNVVRSHVLLGKIYLEMGNIEKAAKSFEDAETVDPMSVDPQYYMGLLHERTARKEAALARYLKASDLDPASPQYALAAAEVMIDLGQIAEARTFLEDRRGQFENSPGIRQTLGHIAMMQGDLEHAVAEFTDARMLAPDDQGICEDLAQVLYESKQYSEAEAILAKILSDEANAERRDLQLMQANCLTKLDRLNEARAILIPLTADEGGSRDVEAFIALGNVSFMMQDMVRVRQTASRIIAMAPKRPEGYLFRALHMRFAGDFTNAETAAKQATDFGGGSEAWTLLGMIQRELGHDEAAKQSFSKAEWLNQTTESADVPEVRN